VKKNFLSPVVGFFLLSLFSSLSIAPPAVAEDCPLIVDVSASNVFGRRGKPLSPPPAILATTNGKEIKSSNDQSEPRFTFLPRKGRRTQSVHLRIPIQNSYDYYPRPDVDWLHYDFLQSEQVSSVDVYWLDDGDKIRVPTSWRLLYRQGKTWRPVENVTYGTKTDQYNHIAFPPVKADGLILEVKMQEELSAGVLQFRINGKAPEAFPAHTGKSIKTRTRDFLKMRLGLAIALRALADQPESELYRKYRRASDDLEAAARKIVKAQEQTERLTLQSLEYLSQIKTPYNRGALKRLHTQLDKAKGRAVAMRALIAADWAMQDAERKKLFTFDALTKKVCQDIKKLDARTTVDLSGQTAIDRYLAACELRRKLRMTPHVEKFKRLIYTRHHDIGGSHYAYTELLSNQDHRTRYSPRADLCLLEMNGIYGRQITLLNAPRGIIRDPDVSYDGKKILFSWRKSMGGDDYSLYEMDAETRKIRQLTNGPRAADYEGIYLPDGNIMFNSTRCQQAVDCAGPPVSNLYLCDKDGKYIRRIGFDQVHTNYPQVLSDGRVVYTRWDYNDRGQVYTQPLFQMHADGTGQTEYYGNNSWFPVSILHARGIPGTSKVLCILSGHHAFQRGKIAIIDPSLGRQETSGVQLVAPVRETKLIICDPYGHKGHQFTHPYPLTEKEFLVSFSPFGSPSAYSRIQAAHLFGVYFANINGDRELLAADPTISSSQPIPLKPRKLPPVWPSTVDYAKNTGTYYMQDIYVGPGLRGVKRGTIKSLRVVALEYRAASIGRNFNRGPAGGARIVTPISVSGAWDVKKILGTAKVYDDGSAAFVVPALTPVYFQALNDKGEAVQSMRSWSTLQPGEFFSCVGCHEDKALTPTGKTSTEAMRVGPQKLAPFYGPARPFGFIKEVQPTLNKHCVGCHSRENVAKKKAPFSLETKTHYERESRKVWSEAYTNLANRKYCNWIDPQSPPSMLPPYHAGAVKSPIIAMLRKGHNKVKLSKEELDKMICWIDLAIPYTGNYTEGMSRHDIAQYNRWLAVQKKFAKQEKESRKALAAQKK